jgi:hypothetical protein
MWLNHINLHASDKKNIFDKLIYLMSINVIHILKISNIRDTSVYNENLIIHNSSQWEPRKHILHHPDYLGGMVLEIRHFF